MGKEKASVQETGSTALPLFKTHSPSNQMRRPGLWASAGIPRALCPCGLTHSYSLSSPFSPTVAVSGLGPEW